jgi:HK97 gp10 family phage protein
MIKVSVTGVKEIDNVLRALPRELTHQVLGAAHLAAAKPLIEREHLLAPVGETGNLAESIGGVKTPLKKASEIGEVQVGPRRTRDKRGHHGHLVEKGTKKRRTKSGANRGIMPAQPFAEPAFEQTKHQVEKNIANEVGRVVWRTMKRHLK